jgi:peptide/nickel transport system substrate-binding protein
VRGTLDPLPRAILGEAYARNNPDAFLALPYWNAEFVGLGPFKVVQWSPGSFIELTHFDDYFRGRPRLDTVIIRFIADSNTMTANLLAGEVDMLMPPGISLDTAKSIEQQWAGTGNRVLVAQSGRLRFVSPQYRPDVQHQPALLDPAVRRAMYGAIDRAAVADAVTLGFGPAADSFIPPDDVLRKDLESAIPPSRFDLATATRALTDLGWTKGGDGILRNREGRAFEFQIKSGQAGRTEIEQNGTIDGWKQLGMRIDQSIESTAQRSDDETRAKFPGMEITAIPFMTFFDTRLHSKFAAAPANRWVGGNRGAYSNATAETLIDRLTTTIPKGERLPIMRDIVREYQTEMAIFALYWDPDPLPVTAKFTGIPQPSANTQVHTFNVWEWDMQ